MQLRGAGRESEGCGVAASGESFVLGRGWGQQAGSDGKEHLGFIWRQQGAREDSRAGLVPVRCVHQVGHAGAECGSGWWGKLRGNSGLGLVASGGRARIRGRGCGDRGRASSD